MTQTPTPTPTPTPTAAQVAAAYRAAAAAAQAAHDLAHALEVAEAAARGQGQVWPTECEEVNVLNDRADQYDQDEPYGY